MSWQKWEQKDGNEYASWKAQINKIKGQSPGGWNSEKVRDRAEGKGQLRSSFTKHNLCEHLGPSPSVGSHCMKYSLILRLTQGLFWWRPNHQWDLCLESQQSANVTQTRVRRKPERSQRERNKKGWFFFFILRTTWGESGLCFRLHGVRANYTVIRDGSRPLQRSHCLQWSRHRPHGSCDGHSWQMQSYPTLAQQRARIMQHPQEAERTGRPDSRWLLYTSLIVKMLFHVYQKSN